MVEKKHEGVFSPLPPPRKDRDNHTQAAAKGSNNLKCLTIECSNFPFHSLFTFRIVSMG